MKLKTNYNWHKISFDQFINQSVQGGSKKALILAVNEINASQT